QVFNGALPFANGSATPSGWTAGLGLEWAFFGGNFTAFAEYDYASFGTTRVNYTVATPPGLTFPLDVKQSVNLFLFGVNYRFGVGGRAYAPRTPSIFMPALGAGIHALLSLMTKDVDGTATRACPSCAAKKRRKSGKPDLR